jgi:hypothetical protein
MAVLPPILPGYPWVLPIQQAFHIACAMQHVNDLNAISLRQVEDQPILKIFHSPAANPAQGKSAKTTKGARVWRACQQIKAFI